MGKIALIGGSGFVGTRLIGELGVASCLNIDKRRSDCFDEITLIQDITEDGLDEALSKNVDSVVLLAAEHRDDVRPVSRYYEVNVQGTKNVLDAMDRRGIGRIVFTSSVAVYGLNKEEPGEEHPEDPFNHYGKSKWIAEGLLRDWQRRDPSNRSLSIVRPTVIFGEGNRGNVYNLLRQIASGNFIMIGGGNNRKSMAYVGNVAAFISYLIQHDRPGYRVFNYIDKPDLNMNQLVSLVCRFLGRDRLPLRMPQWLGMIGGYGFDLLSMLTRRAYPVSSVRVRKFCATTSFSADRLLQSGFIPPYTIEEGLQRTLQYEFVDSNVHNPVFFSE